MRITKQLRHATPLCGLAIALAAPTLAAQQTMKPTVVTASAISEAHALHDQAEALRTSTIGKKDMKRAAKMHLHAADLRGEEAADNYTCIWTAAALYYGAGDNPRAASLLERAADQAANRGDVVNAASALIDASSLASTMSMPERAVRLARRAESLTTSPLLSDTQRAALRARISGAREVALAH